MKWIDFASPTSVDEAVGLLAKNGEKARVLAGGTDLIVHMRGAALQPDLVVDAKSIPELMELTYSPQEGLTIGAALPCYRMYQNAEVAAAYPGVIDAASLIGGIQIQGRASFGGNLCNSVPSADTIPPMIAHSAVCNIAGPGGTRQVAVEDFCTAPRKNVLGPGEMLVSIHFPPPPPNFGARYIRFIPRNEMDIAVVGVGASVVLDNGTIKSARVSLAAVAPRPLVVQGAADALVGKSADDEDAINAAGQAAKEASKPINDMRGTIEYRKHLCDVLTRRALKAAITRAKGGTIDAH